MTLRMSATRGAPDASRPAGRFEMFDAIRVAAAVGVILSHSFPLTGSPGPSLRIGSLDLDLGTACVGIFFTISGFLICASWVRQPSLSRFSLKRFARIWPGYLTCLALTALVVGPLVTTEAPAAYLHDPATVAYLGHNAVMTPIVQSLPGVFTANPYGPTVNGSLWTLPYEMLAYVGVAVLGLLGAFRRTWILGVAILAVLIGFQLVVAHPVVDRNPSIVGLDLHSLVFLGAFFALGALIFASGRTPRRGALALAGAAALVAVVVGLPLVFLVAMAVGTIALGSIPSEHVVRWRRAGDPSFGIYIYGFVVQQVLVAAGLAAGGPWLLFLEATVVSLALGYLSWHLIEERAMRRLRRPAA